MFQRTFPPTETELMGRALRAYFMMGNQDQPSNTSGVEQATNGKAYVVLRNIRGILAVYRLRNDGILRRLRRWPDELDPKPKAATKRKKG